MKLQRRRSCICQMFRNMGICREPGTSHGIAIKLKILSSILCLTMATFNWTMFPLRTPHLGGRSVQQPTYCAPRSVKRWTRAHALQKTGMRHSVLQGCFSYGKGLFCLRFPTVQVLSEGCKLRFDGSFVYPSVLMSLS